ncbi:MAG TPA: hypothetical protein GXZ85_01105 [Firmicutes bacterium]|jgi:hypothetical protein|nr:hypothetical protein [Bacillota bacterium]
MEYFLVFLLGIIVTIISVFVVRPSLFTRPNVDFAMLETVVEESIAQLETRQGEIIKEIEEKHQALLELQEQIIAKFVPADAQSPKVLAVLELAEKNEDLMGIAKKLGLGLGEVELILELNKEREPLAESD